MGISVVPAPSAGKEKRVDRFTASGTWTPPAGVTYAIAHCLGGGGGAGINNSGTNGGNSSVAFSSGTITALGATKVFYQSASSGTPIPASVNNLGRGGQINGNANYMGADAQWNVGGGTCTPGVGVTVTVGAGGTFTSTGANGGSGYVWIEYEV